MSDDSSQAPPKAPRGQLRFRDRDPKKLGVWGAVGAVALMGISLNYDRIPYVNGMRDATVYVADAAGLDTGDHVQVAGMNVGTVRKIELDGDRVRVRFAINRGVELGADTSAQIKTDSILGRRALGVFSDGRGDLEDNTIPIERTSVPYSLTSALGDLSDTVEAMDTDKVDEALTVLAETMEGSSPEVRGAIDGITRLSRSLNERDEGVRQLLEKAAGTTDVLGRRSDQINQLMVDGNTLFTQLDLRRRALSELIMNIDELARQLSGLVQDNEAQLGPALDKLEQVSDLLIRNKDDIDLGLRRIVPFSTALSEAVASGPWFNAYISNLSLGHYQQTIVRDLLPLIDDRVQPEPGLVREPTMPGTPELTFMDEHPGWGEKRVPR
ncbi:phospholipid/cholesterol/gamma-HCH transport system substrate-binding protein [Dietzia kunjamensis]|uniref:MCE family protein n=1 Tax=Dietzia TaxID=37914 RepID=UPI000E7385F3|nr:MULTISPECIES: MCE family protein [Dietzia]MVZ90599.1 MCE family protein [Microbacter sp. ANSKLAB05]MBB1011459.1 MCE family protein [Dietzia kunjamensis]MEB8327438.1 MCE family protein [Dietzia kunjamensis]RKE65168.1 phospholipid/cholesterol/gamma-HCH transport system substrate-binding protein [Dietzia kunjamensis]USX46529.1 MCE family protein [Dietzia kunjamensis]